MKRSAADKFASHSNHIHSSIAFTFAFLALFFLFSVLVPPHQFKRERAGVETTGEAGRSDQIESGETTQERWTTTRSTISLSSSVPLPLTSLLFDISLYLVHATVHPNTAQDESGNAFLFLLYAVLFNVLKKSLALFFLLEHSFLVLNLW